MLVRFGSKSRFPYLLFQLYLKILGAAVFCFWVLVGGFFGGGFKSPLPSLFHSSPLRVIASDCLAFAMPQYKDLR